LTRSNDELFSSILNNLKISGKKIETKIISDFIQKTIPETVDKSLKETKKQCKKDLPESRLERIQFEKRLYERWKKPIDLLEIFINICRNEGSKINQQYRAEASQTKDYVFDVLTKLHARGCQISFEILTLLKSGFPEGAHARWRTLHEIAVISYFIMEKGQNIAERYLKFEIIESYKEAIEFQKHAPKLGYEPLTQEEMTILENERDEVIRKYGKDFGS